MHELCLKHLVLLRYIKYQPNLKADAGPGLGMEWTVYLRMWNFGQNELPKNIFDLKGGHSMPVETVRNILLDSSFLSERYSYILAALPWASVAWKVGLSIWTRHFCSDISLVCRYYFFSNIVYYIEVNWGIYSYSLFHPGHNSSPSNCICSMCHLSLRLQLVDIFIL